MSPRSTVLPRPPARPSQVLRRAVPAGPRADVFDPPARQLPTHDRPVVGGRIHPRWLFVAAHGGSGAGLLAELSWQAFQTALDAGDAHFDDRGDSPAYALDAGRGWPDPALDATSTVVVVCRTTMHGLGWARDAAVQHLSGTTPAGLQLLGLATVADQSGRLPRPLAAARGLLDGIYPDVWDVPYVPEYRLLSRLPAEPTPPVHPGVGDVLTAIRTALTPKGPLA